MSRTAAANQVAIERMAVSLERVVGLLEEINLRLRLHEPGRVDGEASSGRWARRRWAVTAPIDEPKSSRAYLRLASRVDRILLVAASRRRRPWLAGVGVALAVTAAMLARSPQLLLPLAASAWWSSPDDWRWTWVTPIVGGLLGAAWVTVVTGMLAAPAVPLIAVVVWVGATLAFAGLGAVLRRVMSDA
jgi:hypothetical protein